MNNLKKLIDECVRKAIYEGVYDKTATPHISKAEAQRALGINPLRTDVGGHAAHDEVTQPSTQDFEGEKFRQKIEHLFVSDNKYLMYKVKNFGNPDVKDTMQFFGNTAEFRRAKDTIDGASKRGGKPVFYRTISPEKEVKSVERSDFMIKTFWEFSFNGEEWYIMKPNPVQTLKISKFVKK